MLIARRFSGRTLPSGIAIESDDKNKTEFLICGGHQYFKVQSTCEHCVAHITETKRFKIECNILNETLPDHRHLARFGMVFFYSLSCYDQVFQFQ